MFLSYYMSGECERCKPSIYFSLDLYSSQHTPVECVWSHTVLRVFMIHCYFKRYETHADLPISYMRGIMMEKTDRNPIAIF